MEEEMSELNKIRKDRVRVWCDFNGWIDVHIKDEHWWATPPGESEPMRVPSVAYKPPFPGDIPEGS